MENLPPPPLPPTPPCLPPPLPALPVDNQQPFPHRAAKFAITVILVGFALSLFGQLMFPVNAKSGLPSGFLSLIGGALILSAIPASIIAFCGIPKHGCSYLLWRGLVGILVPMLMFAMAVPAFLKVRDMAGERYFTSLTAEISKGTPKMLDEMTRLEKAVASPGKKITLHLTVTSFKLAELDMEIWASQVRPKLKAGILETPVAIPLLKGGTLTYVYSDSAGAKIDEITLTAADLPAKPRP